MSVLGEMLMQDLEKVRRRFREADARGDEDAMDALRDEYNAIAETIAEVEFEELS